MADRKRLLLVSETANNGKQQKKAETTKERLHKMTTYKDSIMAGSMRQTRLSCPIMLFFAWLLLVSTEEMYNICSSF